MDEIDRDELRREICERIPEVEREIERLREQIRPVEPDRAIGRLTRMDAISDMSIKEANLRSAEERLSLLRAALSKIDDPDFGICVECGEPIPKGRLLARPESTRCVQCAS